MKLWSGRFQKETDSLVNDFNSSIRFDSRMYREDIAGSIAHAAMLGQCGIIAKEDADAIIAGLQAILADVEAGKIEFSADQEDIHMNVETLLTQRIGDAGKRLHTARSRNDQVAVDLRLYLKQEIGTIIGQILHFQQILLRQAKQYQDAVMPGYTHLQRAQPISFAQHLLAYANMLCRDVTRLEDCRERMDECPLGSGALAGTTYPIDRMQTAQALGFRQPMSNSLDGVSDRDYVIELLSGLSILMMHLSRFAEETILWCSWEFRYIELDDAYSTGSSIMPQKKNLPLAYNKDMQEDKEPVFDAVDTVKLCLPVFAAMIDTMKVHTENMRQAANRGFINATDCADYLTKKGMPFRDAYTTVGKLVYYCTQQGKTLEQLSLAELQDLSPLFGEDVYTALDMQNCMEQRKSYGGPAIQETTRQIEAIAAFIEERT